jgi:DNA-binding MarR family transcriptional regulator
MNKTDIIREKYYQNPDFIRSELAKELSVDEAYIRRVIRPLKKMKSDKIINH